MKFKTFLAIILYFYLLWIPLEWFVFGWFSADYASIKTIRITIDVLPLLIMLLCLTIRQVRIFRMNASLLVLLLATTTLLIIANLVHGAKMTTIFGYAGALFRFLPFAIIIPNLRREDFNFERFASSCKVLLLLFVVLGVLEAIVKQPLRNFLLPEKSLFTDTLPVAYREEAFYQITTTFVNTIDYCFFIVGLYIVYVFLATKKKQELFFVSLLTLIAVYFTYSIAGLGCFLVVAYFALIKRRAARYVGYFLAAFAGVAAILSHQEELAYYFFISEKYSRVAIIVHTLPHFLTSSFVDVLLGLGTDSRIVYDVILAYPKVPLMLAYDDAFSSLKDVYWVALLLQQGLISFAFLLAVFFKFYYLSSRLPKTKMTIVRSFLIVVFVVGFINQILDIKSFSFLFWVVIGLMFKEIREQRTPGDPSDDIGRLSLNVS